jgi:hypothetical protein
MGSVVPMRRDDIPDLTAFPTVYTNEDGTFSPAIMISGYLYIERAWKHAQERPMMDLATIHFLQIRERLRCAVIDAGYKEEIKR